MSAQFRGAVLATMLLLSTASHADHGPGTSGGGIWTQSGETLAPMWFSLELRTDYTEFEGISISQLEKEAAKSGSFDSLDRSTVTTLGLNYGVVENLQFGLTLGYYDAVKAREAEFDPSTGEAEILTFDPDGLTDLWLTGKYRFYRGPLGSIALFAGAKFPTGKFDVKNSEGERVEPSATAGSGSYDGMFGLAYSRFLTSRLTFDTSAQYIVRGKAAGFKLGDRIDAGLSFAYRFNDDIGRFPQFSSFVEANVRHLFKSEEENENDPNTGGTVLFLTPGIRAALTPNVALTLSTPLPAVQELNGAQLETSYKVNAMLALSF